MTEEIEQRGFENVNEKIDFELFLGKKVRIEIFKPGYKRGFNLYGHIKKYDDSWVYFKTDKLGLIRIEDIIGIEVL